VIAEPDDPPAGAVFAALADPTRRHVVRTLAAGTSATASGLADQLPMSRQAVAKHLAALRAAGLVEAERAGRETRYTLRPEPLAAAAGWLHATEQAWDARLRRLRDRASRP
jgi:DNA-binding transcriptional ArsR family regulator